MSRIFDAIKRAERARRTSGKNQNAVTSDGESWERRRSRRWTLDVQVFVYGHKATQEPFHEEAHTLDVSAYGGRLVLAANVHPGQKLLLTNRYTQAEQECTVVYLGPRRAKTTQVAIEFNLPNARFWPVPSRQ
ncbi:MAG TPA: PilZ domain-containing protein [Methylomirabilota bacterium]|nr:PilZ domain-containing protein [Methylomirabilota bacterium]